MRYYFLNEKEHENGPSKEIHLAGGRDDGASLCSNLIVEPIKYIPEGVGNPGGVYRRTISRYDAGYVATLLERFKKNED